MTIEELRKERHHIASKISNWKKSGKDVTDLLKQEAELVAQIKQAKKEAKPEEVVKQITLNAVKKEAARVDREAKKQPKAKPAIEEYKVKTISKEEQKQMRKASERENEKLTGKAPKSWTKTQLESCDRTMCRLLEDNDWRDGYQFRSSEWMSIKNINTRVLPDSVELSYTIQYRTKNHRVEKSVSKFFNPDTIGKLAKYIEQVELWVMLNSGDMDDKSIVFGTRFNKVQFDAKGMAEQGWIIKK